MMHTHTTCMHGRGSNSERKGITSMYDAPCGAMVWTEQFLKDIRKNVPHFKYKGVDIVEHVVQGNQGGGRCCAS